MKLSDLAQVIRSKNAGPRRLTLDVMFATDADYHRVAQSPALGAEAVGRLYGVPADQVTVIPYPAGRAIKKPLLMVDWEDYLDWQIADIAVDLGFEQGPGDAWVAFDPVLLG